MIIEQYGIRLRRIEKKDLEIVRYWRNHPSIQKKMNFRGHITVDMQKKWFELIDNKFNYYFIIEYNEKKIGLINTKNIDNNLSGEGGVFIWDKNIDNEYVPVFASLCLLNAIYLVLEFSTVSTIQILSNNKEAIAFNKSLGYELLPNQEECKVQLYKLTKENYKSSTLKLNKIAQKISGDFNLPRIKGLISTKNLEIINVFLKKQVNFF